MKINLQLKNKDMEYQRCQVFVAFGQEDLKRIISELIG
jgi:hypothetical protein